MFPCICKYAPDGRIKGIFCFRRNPANFCHPDCPLLPPENQNKHCTEARLEKYHKCLFNFLDNATNARNTALPLKPRLTIELRECVRRGEECGQCIFRRVEPVFQKLWVQPVRFWAQDKGFTERHIASMHPAKWLICKLHSSRCRCRVIWSLRRMNETFFIKTT